MKPNLLKNVYATIAALFVAMFALPTTAQAQGTARIILEAHNVWQDGSGYQMLLDADHNLYGSKIPDKGPLWDNDNPPTDLYDGFEYKIPTNADPSTKPKYMVVDGEAYIDIPAGVYDFCIAAPEADKTIWIAGDADGPTRADDYRFEAGKTYRFAMYIPEGSTNDGAKLTITGNGAPTTYALTIAGTQVTSANCNNLSVIPGVTGTVNYNPDTKVLTLQNAKMELDKTEEHAIYSEITGLIIKVVGTNELDTKNATISFRNPLTITGGGLLKLDSDMDCAIYANGTDLTIDNCTVDAESDVYGIAGYDGTKEKLTIRNATVMAEGKESSSICDFATLSLIGCNLTQPVGAIFDTSLHCVALNGTKVTTKVVITKDPTAIEAATADNAAGAREIYTLSGVRQSGELKDLPKGVYIVNGKKVVKQ